MRGRSQSDGRKQTLNLTPAGRKALVTAKRAIQQHEHWLKSRFTDKEVATADRVADPDPRIERRRAGRGTWQATQDRSSTMGSCALAVGGGDRHRGAQRAGRLRRPVDQFRLARASPRTGGSTRPRWAGCCRRNCSAWRSARCCSAASPTRSAGVRRSSGAWWPWPSACSAPAHADDVSDAAGLGGCSPAWASAACWPRSTPRPRSSRTDGGAASRWR